MRITTMKLRSRASISAVETRSACFWGVQSFDPMHPSNRRVMRTQLLPFVRWLNDRKLEWWARRDRFVARIEAKFVITPKSSELRSASEKSTRLPTARNLTRWGRTAVGSYRRSLSLSLSLISRGSLSLSLSSSTLWLELLYLCISLSWSQRGLKPKACRHSFIDLELGIAWRGEERRNRKRGAKSKR